MNSGLSKTARRAARAPLATVPSLRVSVRAMVNLNKRKESGKKKGEKKGERKGARGPPGPLGLAIA